MSKLSQLQRAIKNLQKFTNRLVGPFREFGVFNGALYFVARAFEILPIPVRLITYDIVVQAVRTTPFLPHSIASRYIYRTLGPDDDLLKQMPVRREIIANRIAQGSQCIAVFTKDEIVGYGWIAKRAYYEDEVRCVFQLPDPDLAVFDFDIYIYPSKRMGFGFAALWDGINKTLRGSGFQYTYSRIFRFNKRSMKSHESLGARKVGSTTVLKLHKLELMMSTLHPFVGITTQAGKSVQIRLPATPIGLKRESNSDR